jgi:endonuclease/exonuclease/phosphatase (EEP) superfamily protein YafD
VIAGLSALAACAVAIATALSFARDWRFALIVHFRPHLAAVSAASFLLVAAAGLPAGPKLVMLLAAGGAALVNLREIVRATPRGAPVEGGQRLRLAFANLLRSNRDARRLIDWVRREQVDVLVVAESIDAWPRQLGALGGELPFVVSSRIGDVAIYSRHEIAGEPRHFFPSIGHAVAVEVAGLTVMGLHTASPEDRTHSAACDELIATVAGHIENLRGPVAVVGDFNATPWSRPVLRLIARTGLAYGPGARIGSFPAELGGWKFPTWIALPIDLVLAGRGAVVAQRRHGPLIGSDHWPVIAEILYSPRLDPSDPRP